MRPHSRVQPADQRGEIQLAGVVHGPLVHAGVPGGDQPGLVGLPRGGVGTAAGLQPAVEPLLQAAAHGPGPRHRLLPQRGPVGDDGQPAARPERSAGRREQVRGGGQVDRVGDGHRGQRGRAEQRRQPGQVAVRAGHPGHVRHALLGSGLPGQREHVRFRVDPGHRPDLPGQREGQLPGAAADIGQHIVRPEPERPGQQPGESRRVAAPEPGIERRGLATEVSCHQASVPAAGPPGQPVPRTAVSWAWVTRAQRVTRQNRWPSGSRQTRQEICSPPGPGRGETCRSTYVPPSATTRCWAVSRSLTSTSKCTPLPAPAPVRPEPRSRCPGRTAAARAAAAPG